MWAGGWSDLLCAGLRPGPPAEEPSEPSEPHRESPGGAGWGKVFTRLISYKLHRKHSLRYVVSGPGGGELGLCHMYFWSRTAGCRASPRTGLLTRPLRLSVFPKVVLPLPLLRASLLLLRLRGAVPPEAERADAVPRLPGLHPGGGGHLRLPRGGGLPQDPVHQEGASRPPAVSGVGGGAGCEAEGGSQNRKGHPGGEGGTRKAPVLVPRLSRLWGLGTSCCAVPSLGTFGTSFSRQLLGNPLRAPVIPSLSPQHSLSEPPSFPLQNPRRNTLSSSSPDSTVTG